MNGDNYPQPQSPFPGAKSSGVGYSQGINAPDLDPITLKPRISAVKDFEQAYLICKNIVGSTAAEQRNKKNARIIGKYNDDPPYDEKELEQSGNGWMSNFSSGFLSSVIDQVYPRFWKQIQSLESLTESKLPDTVLNATLKTDRFRRSLTKMIRRWDGWKSYVASEALETSMLGAAFSIWTDEYDWRPMFVKQDNAFVPEGCGQRPKDAQWLVVKQSFLIHELLLKIQDREAAELAGWNIEATVKAINDAYPHNPTTEPATNYRAYEELIRETTVGTSYTFSAKTIDVFHLFAQEAEGPISHYIVRQDTGTGLFQRENRFKDAKECLTLFTYQEGDLKFYGSKGLGRLLFNNHLAIERARNRILDQVFLAGLRILKTDATNKDRVECQVSTPFMIVDNAFDIIEQPMEADVNGFILLDNHLTQIAMGKAGAYSPAAPTMLPNMPKQTATRDTIQEGYREELRDILQSRFMGHIADVVSQIQRKAANPETIDPEAIAFRQECLEVMTEQELQFLANEPAAERIEDFSNDQDQKTLAFFESEKMNPNVNQYEGLKKKATIMMGEEAASVYVLPQNDPTVLSENIRQQMQESALARAGAVPPVSPRDNHIVHLDYLTQELLSIKQKIEAGDMSSAPFASFLLQHYEMHLQMMEQGGYPEKQLSTYKTFFTQMIQELQQFQEQMAIERGTIEGIKGAIDQLTQPQQGEITQPEAANPNAGINQPTAI